MKLNLRSRRGSLSQVNHNKMNFLRCYFVLLRTVAEMTGGRQHRVSASRRTHRKSPCSGSKTTTNTLENYQVSTEHICEHTNTPCGPAEPHSTWTKSYTHSSATHESPNWDQPQHPSRGDGREVYTRAMSTYRHRDEPIIHVQHGPISSTEPGARKARHEAAHAA